MTTPHRTRGGVLLTVVAALLASGCDGQGLVGTDDDGPRVLVVSPAWLAAHPPSGAGSGSGGAATGGSDARARISALHRAITDLRDETHSGWVGRQDDQTGYLADLSGGVWPGTPAGFLAAHGSDLFGVDGSAMQVGGPDGTTVPGAITTRATQQVAGVPVLDGALVFTSRQATGDGTGGERVTGVHGRVFPGLQVDTTPILTADQAAAVAQQRTGGTSQQPPSLAVVPTGTGVLTWAVPIVSASGSTPLGAGTYYVDATSGAVVSVRQSTSDGIAAGGGFHPRLAARLARLARPARPGTGPVRAPDPDSVEISGTGPAGQSLTGHGVRSGAGVALVDTTTDDWSQATRAGGVYTYDASRVKDNADLPGTLATSPTQQVADPDEIAAQALTRDIYDYYRSLGRSSWDDRGSSMISSVHYGAPDYCNAFFSSSLRQPQMVYGGPCTIDGRPVSSSLVDIDVAAHEITHGVTASTAGLIYSGQSGALNEGFSDYFGNVIGNRVNGTDSVAIAEGTCTGITAPNPWCSQNPDGSLSLRYMLNGNTFDDYLRVLDPGLRLSYTGAVDQDNGAVHLNSAVWNNALWSIRSTLATIDHQSGNDSPLAQAFDRAVYGALTTRLTPTSGFVDAADAVMQVISDSRLDPVVLRTAQSVFQHNDICAGCGRPASTLGDVVAASAQTQLHPSVSGDQIAWLDLSSGDDVLGFPAQETAGSTPTLGSTGNLLDVVFDGTTLLGLDGDLNVVRYGPDGSPTTLGRTGVSTLVAGLAGSDQGAAYLSADAQVSFVDTGGRVTSTAVPGLGGGSVTALATGSGQVTVGTQRGVVLQWTPGGQVRPVTTMSAPVMSLATYAGRVFAVDLDGNAVLVTDDGQSHPVSRQAVPFGAAMSSQYVVWTQATGPLAAGVVPANRQPYPDTDLYLLSLRTGKLFDLGAEEGQQGFPALSGNRLAWQDAVYGGDDIFTAELPDGL